ncbi:hypothetical protein [Kosakonia sp. 1610]|uniref:hypothetical protein n=1 Tax=Kosakonia sp. 1610 TaxID=3156426 RepID=UPI003D1BB526
MSFSDTSNAKRYASIAEVAAAQAKVYASELEGAPDYAAQAAASAAEAAASESNAVAAESIVNGLAISASEAATSAAASAASAGNASSAAIGRSVKVPDGETLGDLPAAADRQSSLVYFDELSAATVKPISDFAILDENGKIPVSVIPAIALTEPFVVDNQDEMLALNAQVGDIAKRTDLGYSFCLASEPSSALSNWVQLTDDVLAQLGQSTGAASVGALNDAGSPTTVQLALNAKANKATLLAQTGATTIGASDSSGSQTTVQGALGLKADSSALASTAGATLLGTAHRGTLDLDLNAIDRRPDGYGNDPAAVLASGPDVQINTNLSRTTPILPGNYQVVHGVGGSITMTAVARAVNAEFKKGFTVCGLRIIGNVVNGPSKDNVAYGVQLEDSENFQILGLDAKQFTGATEILRCNDFVVRDVYARNMRYHDNVAAGGYGVLLAGCKRALIDGINFRASAAEGDLGRHSLYLSVDSLGNFCEDIVVKNLIASYVNIDNRDMPAAVVRRSNRCMIDGFNISGSNGGIGLNADNGVIQDFQIRNGHMKIIQYDDNAVYGISGGVDNQPGTVMGLRVDNFTFEGEVKSGVTPAAVRLHALAVTCRDSYFTNTRIKSHGNSNPILVASGVFNVTFDGVKDFVSAGSASAALIRFMGGNSNIKVFNLDTARPIFAGLENVTDLTVNWTRRATVTITSGTAVISNDTYGILSTVNPGASAITINLASHVTQDAALTARVVSRTANQFVIATTSSKTLGINAYTIAGASVTPSTSSMTFDVVLSS